MPARRLALLLLSLSALPFTLGLAGCGTIRSITIVPNSGATVLTAIGQSTQYKALAVTQMGSASPTTSDITGSAQWSTTNTNVATVNASGVVTAVGGGYSQVIAISGGVVAQSDVTVTIAANTNPVPSLSISPGSTTSTFTGETTQFIATGNLTGVGGVQNLTSTVNWISSNAQIATINASGLATAVGAGTTTITAQSGGLTTTALLTVSLSSTTPSVPNLTIIPGAVGAIGPGANAQLLAIGNLSGNGPVQNLTNSVTWISTSPQVATVSSTGLARSVASPPAGVTVSTTITALAASTTGNGSVVTSTIVFSVTTPPATAVATEALSVYETGSNTGQVNTTAGAVSIINCGNGGTTCTGTYPQGTVVTLTETPAPGATFSGWSGNCTVISATSCQVTMSNLQSVGAAFN